MSARHIVFMIAGGFFLFAVSRALVLFVAHSPQPEIKITPPKAELGTVAVGQAVERTFLIHNSGDSRLLITGVRSSCQCTVAELPTRSIAPGASAELHVTFKAKNAGPKSQTVVIQTNDPVADARTIRITARAMSTTQP